MKTLIITLAILVSVIPGKNRPSKNMLFIVDKSGSMTGDRTGKALQQFVNIAAQPTDDGSMCLYQFAKFPVKWAHGWKKVPSQDAITDAQKSLNTSPVGPYAGYTRIIPALVAALREPKKKMSVIIISDGEFEEEPEDIITALLKWQKWRVTHGYGKALIGCVGVGPSHSDALKAIARMDESIGYYHVQEKREVH